MVATSPSLKAVPGAGAPGWSGGSRGAPIPHGIHSKHSDSSFNLPSHSQWSAPSATHPLHPLTVTAAQIAPHCPPMLAADLPPPPPRPTASLLNMKPLAGKMSSVPFSPRSDAILHCSLLSGKFSGVTAGTGREVV